MSDIYIKICDIVLSLFQTSVRSGKHVAIWKYFNNNSPFHGRCDSRNKKKTYHSFHSQYIRNYQLLTMNSSPPQVTQPASVIYTKPVFDKCFLTTGMGIFKIFFMVLNLIILICAATMVVTTNRNFIIFTSVVGLLVTLAFFFLYLFSVPKWQTKIPWPIIELAIGAVWAFFYFVCLIVASVDADKFRYKRSSAIATAFFCVLAMLLYIASSVLVFLGLKGNFLSSSSATATPSRPNAYAVNDNKSVTAVSNNMATIPPSTTPEISAPSQQQQNQYY
ncbi:hypothetical protein SNEBB_010230 [Seison nebaliae]|nr:hypothetical protein SNEBB_010230 [Seison nebaliae]